MHPMLLVTGKTDGLMSLNGIFQGEVRTDAPLFRPVSPFGAAYLEFRPFEALYLPIAHRLVFSKGSVLPESVAGAKSVCCTAWPFGISEISLSPQRIYASSPEITVLCGAGRTYRLIRDAGRCFLEIAHRGRIFTHLLPADAEKACLAAGSGCMYVSGDTAEGERFALVLSESGQNALLSLKGRDIEFQPGGQILFTENLNDTAGRIRKTVFRQSENGFHAESSQIHPNPDGEFRAVTPEECALCLLEALLYSLNSEAEACLAPGAEIAPQLRALLMKAERVSRLLFTPPDGRSAVALLQKEAPGAYRAHAVYYNPRLIGGEWKILSLST